MFSRIVLPSLILAALACAAPPPCAETATCGAELDAGPTRSVAADAGEDGAVTDGNAKPDASVSDLRSNDPANGQGAEVADANVGDERDESTAEQDDRQATDGDDRESRDAAAPPDADDAEDAMTARDGGETVQPERDAGSSIPPNASLSVPSVVRVRKSDEVHVPVGLSGLGDADEVTLSIAGLPPGVAATASFGPADDHGTGLVITALSTAPAGGPYLVTVTATEPGNRLLAEASFDLRVSGALGSLDTTFGRGGVIEYDHVKGRFESVVDVVIQADGAVVVAGVVQGADPWIHWVRRFAVNGTLDEDFAPIVEQGSWMYGLESLGDGLVLLGYAEPDYFVRQLTVDGKPDQAFGLGGDALTGDEPNFVLRHPDGPLIVSRYGIEALSPSGAPSGHFAYEEQEWIINGALDSQGRVVLAWDRGDGFAIARRLSNGLPDTSFAHGGVLHVDAPPYSRGSGAALIGFREDDGIYARVSSPFGGQYEDTISILGINPDGTIDRSYGTSSDWVSTSYVDSDGARYIFDGPGGTSVLTEAGSGGRGTFDPVGRGVLASYYYEAPPYNEGAQKFVLLDAEGKPVEEFENSDLATAAGEIFDSVQAVTADPDAGRVVLCSYTNRGRDDDTAAISCARFWL